MTSRRFSKLVHLYVFIARMKILSSDTVIEAAEKAGRRILEVYLLELDILSTCPS